MRNWKCQIELSALIALLIAAGAAIRVGGTKVTNRVGQVSLPGQIDGTTLGGMSSLEPFLRGNGLRSGETWSVTPQDVTNGYRLVSETPTCAIAEPTSAAVTNWLWMKRGAYEDAFTIQATNWTFRIPSGAASNLLVFASGHMTMRGHDGLVLPQAFDEDVSILPMSRWNRLQNGVSASAFWHEVTPSNTLVVTWINALLGRNIESNVTFQAEFYPSGDFEYRHADMTRRYSVLNAFDWDGDGLANEIDPEPYMNSGACFGQGTGWVAACFTNSAEIASSGGYANWVGGQVGTGLTNGLYRLTVSVPADAVFPVKVSVGDYRVVATNSGELSFLMEKGVEYGLRVVPHCDGVQYSAVDDISGETRGAVPARGAVSWGGGWSVDGGALELQPPTASADGLCLWLPLFTASPDVGHWGLAAGPVLFTAEMEDCVPDAQISYLWHGNNLVVIDSPNARQTFVHISSFPRWASASMSVTATFCGRDYVSELQFSVGTNDCPTAGLSLTAPANLLATNLWMEGSRSAEAQVAFSSDVATNGTIRVFAMSGGGKIRTSVSLPAEFTVQDATAFEQTFEVDGVEASSLPGDVVLGCEWLDAEGTNALQATASITVVEPTLVTVPSAPPAGLVVLVGSNVTTHLATVPTVVGGLSIEWLTARRRTRHEYEPWTTVSSGGCEGILTMAQAGCFAIAARTICGGGTQSNHLEYVWSHDEGYSAIIQEDLGPCKTGERDHVGVASSVALLNLRNEALTHLGLAEYRLNESVSSGNGFSGYGAGDWKCNRYVADMAVESGLTVPAMHVSSHTWPLPDTQYPPVANEWGSGSVSIAGWTYLGTNVCPEPGFVAGRPSPRGIGHCGIVDYDGWTISARENGISRNATRMLDGNCGYNKPEVTNGSGNMGNE